MPKRKSQASRDRALIYAVEWNRANPERRKKSARDYYHRHRDKVLAKAKAKAAAKPRKPRPPAKGEDPERRRARARAYRAENRDKIAAKNKRHREENPDLYRQYCRNRRARRAEAVGTFSCEDLATIRRAQRDRCAYCRQALKGAGEPDHIIAIAAGGTNLPSNIQMTCRPCNRKKHSKSPEEFARLMGLLI